MPQIVIIQIPYDSGHRDERMGNGPDALIKRGIANRLRTHGEVATVPVELPAGLHAEASALVQLQHAATNAARAAITGGKRPFFLSGNCGTAALSATAALGCDQTGIVWFDAHADCNTPETSPSGFLDGMCLAMLTGQCWPRLTDRWNSFTPITANRIIQIGVRQVDPGEKVLLESLGIRQFGSHNLGSVPEAVRQLTRERRKLYVHLDADVLDVAEGAANPYACAGGLTRNQLHDCLQAIAATDSIAAASITSYDPSCDPDGRIAKILIESAEILMS